MNTQSHYNFTSQQRRARAVYDALRTTRPGACLLATELCVLALATLGVAGILGLRAWFALN